MSNEEKLELVKKINEMSDTDKLMTLGFVKGLAAKDAVCNEKTAKG